MIPIVILTIENEDDRDFMIRLYTEYKNLLYAKALAVLNDPQETEDVIQDVAEKLIDRLELLRGFDEPALAAYLARTARNTALDRAAKASRTKVVSIEDYRPDPDAESSLDETVIGRLDAESLRAVWPLLKEETRSILEMKYFLALSDGEIARSFQIRPDSVRMRLTRARREVREALEKR